MRYFLILPVLLLSACGTPGEVTRFTQKRDMCEHFIGEEPYDAERREFLRASIIETCTGADSDLARLRAKYADDEEVMNTLSRYDNVNM